MGLKEEKRAYRLDVSAKVKALALEVRRAADAAIARTIEIRAEFLDSEQILAYWALPDEVSLTGVLHRSVALGKKVFLPRIDGRRVTFRRWRPGDEFQRGPRALEEPTSEESPDPDRATLALVPGRAFSVHGARLGRGGGYYDRAWSALAELGRICGVAYACQIYEAIPHDGGDGFVDLLVCEQGVVIDRSR